MAIVQKKPQDLRIGEIFRLPSLPPPGVIEPPDVERLVFLGIVGGTVETQLVVSAIPAERKPGGAIRPHDRYLAPFAPLDVEVPDGQVTPEELDALIGAARLVLDQGNGTAMLQALVDRLRPPEPPTLAEALALLADWPSASHTPLPKGELSLPDKTAALLERARRAGVLGQRS